MTKEDRWRQYQIQIDLLKFYFELVVKINTFHYAVTGAILSYYFANQETIAEDLCRVDLYSFFFYKKLFQPLAVKVPLDGYYVCSC